MRATLLSLLAVCTLAACETTPGHVGNMNPEVDTKQYASYSWGLAGIPFDYYEDVTLECLARGAQVIPDISFDMPTIMVDPVTGQPDMNSVTLQAWQLESAQAREDRRQRQAAIDACLTELGFVKFGLTEAQLLVLETMPRGTPERKRYLYSLGSDAAILAAQRI